MMIQLQRGTGVQATTGAALEQRPVIRVVLPADDLRHISSEIETIIDALFDRMPQTNLVVCVRRASGEQAYE